VVWAWQVHHCLSDLRVLTAKDFDHAVSQPAEVACPEEALSRAWLAHELGCCALRVIAITVGNSFSSNVNRASLACFAVLHLTVEDM
jgi:hypothetical protein